MMWSLNFVVRVTLHMVTLICFVGGGYVDGVTSWWMILQNRGDLLVGKIIKL